jgi:membrane protein DedA with SNARE-associated domain
VEGHGSDLLGPDGLRALIEQRSGEPDEPSGASGGRERRELPTPWDGPMQRADRVIVGGIAFAGIYSLALLPLFPVLSSSHPALLELLRPSTAAIVNMGARAGVGQTSFLLAALLGIPSLMMFDWLFWWAGRRWGDRVFVWLLGSDSERSGRRLARLHRLEQRFGPLAVVFAYVLPVPSTLIYAAVGDGGMRLGTFLALDLLGTLVWTCLLATLGYQLGQSAVDVTDAIAHYALFATLGLIAAVIAAQVLQGRLAQRRAG